MTEQATSTRIRRATAVALALFGFGALLAVGFVATKSRKVTRQPQQEVIVAFTAQSHTLELMDRPGTTEKQTAINLDQPSRFLQDTGKPKLPVVRKIILLAPGATVQRARLNNVRQRTQALEAAIVPVQPTPVPPELNQDGVEPVTDTLPTLPAPAVPDASVYESASAYPEDPIVKVTPDQWGPYDVVLVDIVPFSYRPKDHELTIIESANLVITYQPSTVQHDRRQFFRPAILAQAMKELENPEMLASWYGELGTPEAAAITSTAPIDLSIVRPNVFLDALGVSAFQALAIFGTDATHFWLLGQPSTDPSIAFFDGSTTSPITTNAYLYGLDGLIDGTIVAVGSDQVQPAIRFRRPADQPTTFLNASISGNPSSGNLVDVDVLGSTTGWAVGSAGGTQPGLVVRARSTASPAFSAWDQVDVLGNAQRLRAVYAADATHVWVAGENGSIFFYNGSAWVSQSSGVPVHLNDLDGTGTNDVWAVGDAGTILHFNGSAWQNLSATNPDRRNPSSPDNLTDIEAVDAATVWVGGTNVLLQR
ncbi:MAG: hypothetical protein HYZ09_00600, partial [Candidatus Kerfeldbacteria bacterium]|nr:hypothetical protein [Candidatus Kerfeldbacteria bacterium]